MIVLLAKWAFPPKWRVLECGKRVLEKGKTTLSSTTSTNIIVFDCRCWSLLVLAPACVVLRLGCCSQPYRGSLTYSKQFLEGSNFRREAESSQPEVLSTRVLSIAAVYGTNYSLVLESRGSAELSAWVLCTVSGNFGDNS